MDSYEGPGAASTTGSLPKVVSSRSVYKGRVVNMRVDEISLAGGGTATREVIEHPGAVVIIALDHQDRVYLVQQYRHAVRRMLLELPAGCLEPGEEPLAAAKRELREEVGLEAGEWTALGSFFSSPGFVNEHLHVFLARQLMHVPSDPDEDEELTVVSRGLGELGRALRDMPDAKSLAALYLLERDPNHGRQA